jgi:carboxyl-terminal processing protease
MTVKKFIAPQIAALLILSSVWLAGIDTVIVPDNTHQENLTKYLQVQRRVMDNYFGETNIDSLFHQSKLGMARAFNDSSANLTGTPLDTTVIENVRNLRDSYNKFEETYLYVANNFPDQNMDNLVEASIKQMLSTLDPHSVYIEAEESDDIQEQFEGKFQGIGIQFNIIQDTITVITPISGGPSDQLGIMSGDRIVEINDTSAVGYDNEDVIKRLRGEKGTSVDVTIQRPRTSKPLNYTIIRDDIPITTVDSNYMLDNETGYIKVNRFAATTHDEFMTAVNQLEQQGMDRLVLDLSNNPGGFLSQAIAISEEFFPRGTKLVSTKSRHSRFNSEVYSRSDGSLKDTPVIVIVNEGSASASEIVSGAIQDHDRGLIVGKRTFGKGLVQQQYQLVDNSNIRVTISRYFTPSGRLIQKPFDSGAEDYAFEIRHRSNDATVDVNEFKSQIPDSLKYKTMGGREVFGGGGIVPDFIVQEDTTRSYYLYNFMRINRVDFDFVRDYLDREGNEFRQSWEDDYQAFRSEFTWSENDEEIFLSMMKESGVIFDEEADEPSINDEDELVISRNTYNDLKWMNFAQMKAELARQVYGSEYFYPIINDALNESLNEAMTLWETAENIDLLVQTPTGSLMKH